MSFFTIGKKNCDSKKENLVFTDFPARIEAACAIMFVYWGHDSFVGVKLLIHTCDVTHSYV